MNTSTTYRLLESLLFIAAIHFYVATARDIAPGSPPKSECSPVCDAACKYGHVLDERGCPTCPCNQCPPVPDPKPEICSRARYASDCVDNSNCTTGLVCCPNECGVPRCTKLSDTAGLVPVVTKCPARSADLPPECAFTSYMPNCNRSSDCKSGEECCPNECQVPVCYNPSEPKQPVPEESDQCPVWPAYVPERCMTSKYAPQCSVHSDCPTGLCCHDQCGIMMCTKPPEPVKTQCEDWCIQSPCCTCHHSNNESACACADLAPGSRGCFFGSCSDQPCLAGEKCSDLFGDGRSYICQKECPVISCRDCKCGCVKDGNGCDTCNTACGDPCSTVTCQENEDCKVITINCFVAPCEPPRAECVPKPAGCPKQECQTCEYGYLDGKDGCPSCDCATDPCAVVFCGPGTVCKRKTVTCIRAPCNPVAECEPQQPDNQFKCPPVIMIGCVNFTKPVDCKLDSDCKPGQICCPIECNGAKCVGDSTQTPTDVCSLPSETGPCKALKQRWYYDRSVAKCMTFSWGGCDGNANNFEDEAGCKAKCETKRPVVDPPPADRPTQDALCPASQPGGEPLMGVCGFMCGPDAPCKNGLICCKTPCGGTTCAAPRQVENPPTNEKTGGGQGSPGNSGPGNSPGSSDDNGTPARAGTCPADRVGRKFKSDEPCSNDNDCPGNKKCCSRGGVKVCRSPDAPKAGTCPNVIKRKLTKGKPVVIKCDCDGECCDNQKCCETETGGFECTVPAGN